MKIRITLFALAAILISFTACNLEGEYNYTPNTAPVLVVNNYNNDTLSYFRRDPENMAALLDTIYVGDTVTFYMAMTSYANVLKEYYVKLSEDNESEFLVNADSLAPYFKPESDFAAGKFIFKDSPQYSGFYFTFNYVATAPSKGSMITFKVVSDADMTYRNFEYKMKTPIKPASERPEEEPEEEGQPEE